MKMYRCESCGLEFFQPKAVEEDRGEFWGMPCSETMYYCPGCGDDCFEEIEAEEEDGDTVESQFTEDDYYDMLIDKALAEREI